MLDRLGKVRCGQSSKDAEVGEDASVEGIRRSGSTQERWKLRAKQAVNGKHSGNAWPARSANENRAKLPKETTDSSGVNEGISTVEVTEGFQKAVRRGFEDDPRVAGHRRLLEGNSETQFEGHVESRRAGM